MKLNKNICKLCIETNPNDSWDCDDEERWRTGLVVCMVRPCDTVNEVPEYCKYKMEYLILGEQNAEEASS